MFLEPKYFKQTRADGTEYFTVSVDYETKWFFGLLSFKIRYWLCKGDPPYLIKSNNIVWADRFKSLEEVKTTFVIALEERKKKQLHSTIVEFKQIEP